MLLQQNLTVGSKNYRYYQSGKLIPVIADIPINADLPGKENRTGSNS